MSLLLLSVLPFAVLAADPADPPAPARSSADQVGGFQSAGELLRKCRGDSSYGKSYCFAYIAAVTDAIRAYQAWLQTGGMCIPASASQGELVDTYEAYLVSNPTLLDSQAASVIVTAFQEHYSCGPAVAPPPREGAPAEPQAQVAQTAP